MLKAALFSTTLCLTALCANVAQAKSWVDDSVTKKRTSTAVLKNDMIVMRTEVPFKEVRVANAKIADVVVMTDKSFQVLGKAGGKTNVMLYDAERQLIDVVEVKVGHDLQGLRSHFLRPFQEKKSKSERWLREFI